MADKLIYGADVVLLLKDLKSEGYQEFICATDCAIETTVETKSVKTVGDGIWNNVAGQKISYVVTLSGLIKLDPDEERNSTFDLQTAMLNMLKVDYRLIFREVESDVIKVIEGRFLIEQSNLTAASEGFATSSFTMQGCGPYIIRDADSDCLAFIEQVAVNNGENIGDLEVTVTGISADTIRFDYSLDGGGRQTVFVDNDPMVFTITDVADGDHTLVIYPICANGEDGTPFTFEFSYDDGCVPVGSLAGLILPNGVLGTPYNYSFNLSGSAPFGINTVVKPSWMLINIFDNTISFSGTPDAAGTDIPISFNITNCSVDSQPFSDTINIIDPSLQRVVWDFTKHGVVAGNFDIEKNFVEIVNVSTTDNGEFPVVDGDNIDIDVNAAFGIRKKLRVVNISTGNVMTDITSSSTTNLGFNFFVTGTDAYTITAEIGFPD